ncbi:MAG TPA: DUF2927 domain-containing protein [Vineibacter sp.]|nr:DUF2927 domain-containing protein [Vineibacter sp.]
MATPTLANDMLDAHPSNGGRGDLSAALLMTARAFDEAALRVNDTTPADLVRWTQPIFVAIDPGTELRPHAPQIIAAVNRLGAIAGVVVFPVAADDPRRNFLLRPADPAGRAACRAAVSSQAGHIVRVEIELFLNGRASLERCINHEILHGFGFRSHPHGAPSILSYRAAEVAQITPTDRLLLETLYDPRLQPGMKVADAALAACTLIGDRLGLGREAVESACANRPPANGRIASFGNRASDPQAESP